MVMIASFPIKTRFVPLIANLCPQIYFRFEISVVHVLRYFVHIYELISMAFITGNVILEPLLDGLLAQIHIDLS